MCYKTIWDVLQDYLRCVTRLSEMCYKTIWDVLQDYLRCYGNLVILSLQRDCYRDNHCMVNIALFSKCHNKHHNTRLPKCFSSGATQKMCDILRANTDLVLLNKLLHFASCLHNIQENLPLTHVYTAACTWLVHNYKDLCTLNVKKTLCYQGVRIM